MLLHVSFCTGFLSSADVLVSTLTIKHTSGARGRVDVMSRDPGLKMENGICRPMGSRSGSVWFKFTYTGFNFEMQQLNVRVESCGPASTAITL